MVITSTVARAYCMPPGQKEAKHMYQFDEEKYRQRVEWFTRARFGMFVHWGLYAIPARGEWLRSYERTPKEEYMQYFYEFNPKGPGPKEWVAMAKQAGMQYAVLTAKHHDGFCLWDTDTTNFKSTNTTAKKDYVDEFLTACREAGLKTGLYYSLLDWHHDDYPHYGDLHHPMRDNPAFGNEKRDFSRYVAYMHRQVEELCTRYGQLDILWFDFSYGNLRGEAWQATELMEMVRRHQPNVIIDNRLEVSGEGFGSLAEGNPTPYHGDFVSPERIIPPNGLRDPQGKPLVWEACVTMNNNWGYNMLDTCYKPAPMLIKKLVECVSKGGNLLLNIGPDANGRIPAQSRKALSVIGEWMERNSESIYGCSPALVEKPDYGRITQKDNTLYVHVFENTVGALPLAGIPKEDIQAIRRLCDGADVPLSTFWNHSDYPDIAFADLGPDPVLPDPVDTVLKVVLQREKLK